LKYLLGIFYLLEPLISYFCHQFSWLGHTWN